jgi:hypothetical protein
MTKVRALIARLEADGWYLRGELYRYQRRNDQLLANSTATPKCRRSPLGLARCADVLAKGVAVLEEVGRYPALTPPA